MIATMTAARHSLGVGPVQAALIATPLLLVGVAIPVLGSPLIPLAIAAIAAIAAAAVHRWGPEAPLLAAVTLTPLIPVGTDGLAGGALGARGGDIRAALILILLGLFLVGFQRGLPSLPAPLRAVAGSLLALAGAGLLAAFINAEGPAPLVIELSHGVGQPLTYLLVIVAIAAALRTREGARDRLLAAFALAICAQALIVGAEFATGAAFDELRGVTRAQGTVGANFLSAMAVLGFFTGLALRTGCRDRRLVLLGGITVLASVMILGLATTRGGIVGVLIGIAYLFLTGGKSRGRLAAVSAAAGLLIAASLVPPVADLWTQRLNLGPSVASFDRTATWISGARMGLDDPVSGLGFEGVAEGLETRIEYRSTPFGGTNVVPHNIWILAFAEGGVANLLAMIAFTAFVGAAIWRRPRRRSVPDRYLVAGLIAIAVIALINNLFTHPEVMVPALLLLTIVAAGQRPSRRESPQRLVEGPRGVADDRG